VSVEEVPRPLEDAPAITKVVTRIPRGASGFLSRNALLVIWFGLVIVFALLLPGVFLSANNIRSTATINAVSALMALAVLVPLVANHFDLSIGYLLGLVLVLTIGFLTELHMNWGLVCVLMVALGLAVGFINGIIVTKVKISSFITTLGTGVILYGIGLWYTGGSQLVGSIPEGFMDLSGTLWGVPLPVVYVLIAGFALWVFLEYTPAGRQMYVVGSSVRTANLLGIRSDRYVVLAFMTSGLMVSIAGIVLASLLQSGSSSTGPEYLLPAFSAVFLGSTSVRPGRPNLWGTLLAVVVLATVVNGLALQGFAPWIQPVFNGVMLIGAVAASVVLLRRREEGRKVNQMTDRMRTFPFRPASEKEE